MYIELIRLVSELEPELISAACRILKKEMFPKFEIKPSIMNLYSDEIPDVFLRLWKTNLEPKEKLRRQSIVE